MSARRSEFVLPGAPRYDRSGPVRWIVSHALRYPHVLVGYALFAVASSVAAAALPRLTGVAFDLARGEGPPGWSVGSLALSMVGVALVQLLTQLGTSWSAEYLGRSIERDAGEELYLSLLGKSQTFHNRQRVGDIMARAGNDVRQLNPMVNPGLSLITRSALGLVVPILFIAALDTRLLLAPVVFVVAFAWALRRYMAALGPVTVARRRAFGALNARLQETVSGIEVVKACAAEEQEREHFLASAANYRDRFVEHGRVQAAYLPTLLVGLTVAVGLGHGLWLARSGAISVGDLVAYMGLLGSLRFPAFISIFTFSLVQLGIAGAGRILELILEEAELDENPTGYAAPMRGEVRFDGVCFGYQGPDGPRALNGVSFHVPAGSTLAIVGQTGSGKSTLTRLLNRIYDVDAGRIEVDGVDVRQWNLERLRQQIAVIEQDVFLFSRTIEENIRFGRPSATHAEVVEAAKAAAAHGFIMELEHGYATRIGERGMTLSGGQRQRIAIARALLTDPRILVLDDATSAIDAETEAQIQRAIHAVRRGRTTFLITHRLAQIRSADQIVVLRRGEVVDRGTHDELMARCALYRRIFARYEEDPWR